MDAPVDDPRRVRSASALEAAVRALAGTQAIDSISVSALCRAAGVSRATFYNHARSPAELLDRVLTAELDVVRERTRSRMIADRRTGVVAGMQEVMEHVDHHRAIYLGPDGTGVRPELRNLLVQHFRTSLLEVYPGRRSAPDGPDDPHRVAMVAGFLANGYFGVFEVWLLDPDISGDRVRELLLEMTPRWMLD